MSFDVKKTKNKTTAKKYLFLQTNIYAVFCPSAIMIILSTFNPSCLLVLPSFPIFHTVSSWQHCTRVHWLISGLWLILVRHQWESNSKRSGKWRAWVSLVLLCLSLRPIIHDPESWLILGLACRHGCLWGQARGWGQVVWLFLFQGRCGRELQKEEVAEGETQQLVCALCVPV